MKRQPILLDEWLRVKKHVGPPVSRYLEAHRFVLDEKASFFVGDLLRRAPLEVLQEHEFARPPYDVTWIEIDHKAYFRGLQAIPHSNVKPGKEDTHVGLLYDHNKVWMIAKAKDIPDPALIPLIVNLHQKMRFDQELKLAQELNTSRLMLRMAMLGDVNVDARSNWWMSDEATEICRSHRMEWYDEGFQIPIGQGIDTVGIEQRVKASTLQGSVGHLKLVLTLALLLSRSGQKILISNEVGHVRTIFKGHNITYKAHHHVTLRLAHRDPVMRFTQGLATGLHRRRHGVRGHWAQTRKPYAMSCDHKWDIVSINKDKYQCITCNAKRWWVKDHARGDAMRGFVTKDYEVTR
jgi:hypothetical protein